MRLRVSILAILIIVILGIIFFPRTTSGLGAIEVYVSIAQGYLGFFSLAFTILFVTIQLSPYSDIDLAGTIFDAISVSYFFFLFVVIFFPLLIVALDLHTPMLEYTSISLAILAFIFFPIFFVHIRGKLRPSSIATRVIRAVDRDIHDKQFNQVAEHIDFLFRITTKAYTLRDYVIVQHTLDCFCTVFSKIQAFPKENADDPATKYLLQRMSDLRRIFLEDSYAIKLILTTLAEIGQQAIQKGLPNADIGRVMEIIELIPWQAINTGNTLALQEAIRTYDGLLTFMSNTIYNKDYQSKLSKWYVLIGAYGNQKSNEYSQRIVLASLRNHIKNNRIDYSVACQQALTTAQSNEYWELKADSVSKFISLWPPTTLVSPSKSKKVKQVVSNKK